MASKYNKTNKNKKLKLKRIKTNKKNLKNKSIKNKNKPSEMIKITSDLGKNEETSKEPIVYGKIYADWCGYCQQLSPEWDKLIVMMKKHTPLRFDINNNEEQSRIQEFKNTFNSDLQHSGYPTIYKLTIKGGAVEYYNGSRDAQNIYNWVISK